MSTGPSSAFNAPHLARVSRSFAFCIAALPEPLRARVGLSYLLCRLLDTIEDARWDSPGERARAFAAFDAALADPSGISGLAKWAHAFSPHVSPGEKELVASAPRLFGDLNALPEKLKRTVARLISSMSNGMQHFARENGGGKLLRPAGLTDVNRYCFFVAGVVGEMLVGLVAADHPGFGADRRRTLDAHHFGQFLQKVNLLKDQVEDERAGRHLVPSRAGVEDAARRSLGRAYEFLRNLPKDLLGFRRFCAWSLFLGTASLKTARSSAAAGRGLKVGRARVARMMSEIEGALADAQRLEKLFESQCADLEWTRPSTSDLRSRAAGNLPPPWLVRAYHGQLCTAEMMELEL